MKKLSPKSLEMTANLIKQMKTVEGGSVSLDVGEKLIETIEAQGQEIEQLKIKVTQLESQLDQAESINISLASDKDEQAGRIMVLEDQLDSMSILSGEYSKRLTLQEGIKQAIEWLTPHPSDGSRAVEKARTHLIELLGGSICR